MYPFVICGQTYIAAINHYDGEKNVEQQVVEVDLKKRNIPLTLLVRSSDARNDCVID